MSLATIGACYLAIGVALAIAAAVTGRRVGAGDVALLVLVWPLGAPLVWTAQPPRDGDELLDALARAQSSPLASILPDAETARVLQSRLRDATQRLAELDVVLARPDFDPGVAADRARELTARGATAAAMTAELRIRTLGQLRELRERYRHDIDEVRELVAQLVTQAELVRLQPGNATASSELVRELVARVEGLGELLAHDLEYPAPAGHS